MRVMMGLARGISATGGAILIAAAGALCIADVADASPGPKSVHLAKGSPIKAAKVEVQRDAAAGKTGVYVVVVTNTGKKAIADLKVTFELKARRLDNAEGATVGKHKGTHWTLSASTSTPIEPNMTVPLTFSAQSKSLPKSISLSGKSLNPARSAGSAQATGTVDVAYSLLAKWKGGFAGSIKIANGTSAPIDGWRMTFDLAAKIDRLWNGTVTGAAPHYTVEDADWNSLIPARSKIELGFTATGNELASPADCTFNGSPCGGGSEPPTPPNPIVPSNPTVPVTPGATTTPTSPTTTTPPGPAAPKCSNLNRNAQENTPVAFTLSCSGQEPLTYSVGQPSGGTGTVALTNAQTGTVTFTPGSETTGNVTFTYSAANPGGTSALATVTVAVASGPAPISVTVDTGPSSGNSFNGDMYVTNNGPIAVDDWSMQFTWGVTSLGSGDGTVTGASPNWTLQEGWEGKLSSGETQTYGIWGSFNGTIPSPVDCSIFSGTTPGPGCAFQGASPVGPPACTDVSGKTSPGASVTIPLSCTNSPTGYQLVTQPPAGAGTATIDSSAGTATFTAAGSTQATSATFTYSATNGGGTSNTATVTVAIAPAPPTCSSQPDSNPDQVAMNAQNATVALTCTGTVTSYSSASGQTTTAGGLVSIPDASKGNAVYTPPADYTGADSFQFEAANGAGSSNVATINLNVYGPPVCASNSAGVAPSAPSAITLSCTGVVTGIDIATEPSHGTAAVASAANKTITYTPTSGYTGTDAFTYTASNAAGQSQQATVTITIQTGSAWAVAPYFDVSTAVPSQTVSANCGTGAYCADIVSVMQQTPLKYFSMAFVTGPTTYGSTCADVGWPASNGGRIPLTDPSYLAYLQSAIGTVRNAGGDVVVSVGGANGTDPAILCPTVAGLTQVYENLINSVSPPLKRLDFDVEGNSASAMSSSTLQGTVLAALQQKYPDLEVSFTIAGDYWEGLGYDGEQVVLQAIKSGTDVSLINAMMMDYGTAAPGPESQNAIVAANLAQQKLVSDFGMTQSEAWNKLGMTMMIGQNDTSASSATTNMAYVLTPESIPDIVSFANQNDVGMLSFWSLGRDQACSPWPPSPNWPALATCSGNWYTQANFQDQPFEYSSAFAAYSGKAERLPACGQTSTAVGTDDPSTKIDLGSACTGKISAFAVVDGPKHGTLDRSALSEGVVKYKPNSESPAGNDAFTFEARGPEGSSVGTAQVALRTPPVCSTYPDVTVRNGATVRLPLPCSGSPSDFAVRTKPTNGKLGTVDSKTKTVAFRATSTGKSVLSFGARNIAGKSRPVNVGINVRRAPPSCRASTATVAVGRKSRVALHCEGPVRKYSLVDDSGGYARIPEPSSPSVDFKAGGRPGSASLSYRAENASGQSNVATVKIAVERAPACPDKVRHNATSNRRSGVLARCLGRVDSYAITRDAKHGRASVGHADNTIRYRPDHGYSGSDSFRVRADDHVSGRSDRSVVKVDVAPGPKCNPRPNPTVIGPETTATIDLGCKGPDLNLRVSKPPVDGTLGPVQSNGTVSYAPDPAAPGGPQAFTVVATDRNGRSTSTTARIGVLGKWSGGALTVAPTDRGRRYRATIDMRETPAADAWSLSFRLDPGMTATAASSGSIAKTGASSYRWTPGPSRKPGSETTVTLSGRLKHGKPFSLPSRCTVDEYEDGDNPMLSATTSQACSFLERGKQSPLAGTPAG